MSKIDWSEYRSHDVEFVEPVPARWDWLLGRPAMIVGSVAIWAGLVWAILCFPFLLPVFVLVWAALLWLACREVA